MTTLIRRREVLLGGLLTAVFTAGFGACGKCHAYKSGSRSGGCLLNAEEAEYYISRISPGEPGFDPDVDIIQRSGDAEFDRDLAHSLGHMAQTFRLLPGFAYYRDDDGMNALATEAIYMRRSVGTILFGLDMREFVIRQTSTPMAAMDATNAHEFGHILQYNRDLIDALAPEDKPPLRAEQMADWLSGYYAAIRKSEDPDYPAQVFIDTQPDFADPPGSRSHGTAEERIAAVSEGFKAYNDRRIDLNAAVDESFNYAMSIRY